MAALSCEEREEDFHARYSCTGKRYRYRIRNSEIRSPFEQDLVWVYYKYHIDAEALDAAAKGFLGTYDYRAFASPGGSVEDTVRTIYDFTVTRDGEMVEFSVTGQAVFSITWCASWWAPCSPPVWASSPAPLRVSGRSC